MNPRVFLLSPANSSGKRAAMVTNPNAGFALAVRLRAHEATLAEVFTFMSGLYFRGKVAYSTVFAAPPPGIAGSYVITPDRGLASCGAKVTSECLEQMSRVPISLTESRYVKPLLEAAARLETQIGATGSVVLLGSIATPKYTDPLLEVFGDRLLFPAEFVGRGDMSRGGLMPRRAESREELTYIPLATAVRKGKRSEKLPKLIRKVISS